MLSIKLHLLFGFAITVQNLHEFFVISNTNILYHIHIAINSLHVAHITYYIHSCSRRDSTSEEITITSTLSTKLLTIQEASGTLERNSSLTVPTSASSSSSSTQSNTSASVGNPASQPRHESSTNTHNNSSSNSSTINGSHNVAPASPSSSNNNLNLNSSNINSTTGSSPQAATPSIQIVQSEQQREQHQQPLQSQSVDSNGCASTQVAASSLTDSPSSRKSSTSSKGKPAKLSTSSSGREEVSCWPDEATSASARN